MVIKTTFVGGKNPFLGYQLPNLNLNSEQLARLSTAKHRNLIETFILTHKCQVPPDLNCETVKACIRKIVPVGRIRTKMISGAFILYNPDKLTSSGDTKDIT